MKRGILNYTFNIDEQYAEYDNLETPRSMEETSLPEWPKVAFDIIKGHSIARTSGKANFHRFICSVHFFTSGRF
jgi:hypothetical protein